MGDGGQQGAEGGGGARALPPKNREKYFRAIIMYKADIFRAKIV